MYAWYSYHKEDPEDELQVVDGVQSDDDDEGDEVVFLADIEDGLEAVPEADRHERDHRREDVPILKQNTVVIDLSLAIPENNLLQFTLQKHQKNISFFYLIKKSWFWLYSATQWENFLRFFFQVFENWISKLTSKQVVFSDVPVSLLNGYRIYP